ncbi:MAG: peptidoglycan-binding domain-containing protein [Paracoccaceae bacterium]
MFSKNIPVIPAVLLSASVALAPTSKASAGDAGAFVAGAAIGGLVGHLATKEHQRKKASSRTSSKKYYKIPSTQAGREIQTSLNYFGFDAGRVDGQLGRRSATAVSNYQAYLGYPVTGQLSTFEHNLLVSSYNRAQAGGYATTQQAAALPDGTRGLLKAYRTEMAGGVAAPAPQMAAVPQPQGGVTQFATAPAPALAPVPAVAAAPATAAVPNFTPATTPASTEGTAQAAPALPSFMGDASRQESLAAHCNKIALLTNSNGGFTTEAQLTDANFALNEQFCLARTYAIETSEVMVSNVSGFTPQQITQQCEGLGPVLKTQIASLSTSPEPDVARDVASFIAGTGMSRDQLMGTAKICLGVGYRTDNLEVALASSLALFAMGEEVYGELIGHHLAQGFGVSQNVDLAQGWFNKSYEAHQTGKTAAFAPGQTGRSSLVQAASLQNSGQDASSLAQPTAALPTFQLSD